MNHKKRQVEERLRNLQRGMVRLEQEAKQLEEEKSSSRGGETALSTWVRLCAQAKNTVFVCHKWFIELFADNQDSVVFPFSRRL